MINGWIGQKPTGKICSKPFPHAILENFLAKERLVQLERALKKERFTKKEADLFSFSQTQELKHSKSKTIKEFRKFMSSKEFLDSVQHLSHDALKTKLKPGTVDMAGFIYADTDYLLPHDDRLEGRKVAYIMHFSMLTAKDGGALELFASNAKDEPQKVVKRIIPKANTIILFPVTKKSWHQVSEMRTKKERLTIAGWLHG